MVECTARFSRADGGTFGLTEAIPRRTGRRSTCLPPTRQDVRRGQHRLRPSNCPTWLGSRIGLKAWNINKFLHLFLTPASSSPRCRWCSADGLSPSRSSSSAFPLAIPIGLLWSFMRMAKSRVPRALGATYINIVRGTPLFLQDIHRVFRFAAARALKWICSCWAQLVLVLNSSAYLAEIFRAGSSVHQTRGQFEAARSLGMNGAQTMFYVIIPQTVRRVIPTMTT